jgi:hypothetical protein
MVIDVEANVVFGFYESKVPISGSWIHLISKNYDTLCKLSDFYCLKLWASTSNDCYTINHCLSVRRLRWAVSTPLMGLLNLLQRFLTEFDPFLVELIISDGILNLHFNII